MLRVGRATGLGFQSGEAAVRPISLLRLSLLRLLDSNSPGNSLQAREFHPSDLRFCSSRTLRNPESLSGDWACLSQHIIIIIIIIITTTTIITIIIMMMNNIIIITIIAIITIIINIIIIILIIIIIIVPSPPLSAVPRWTRLGYQLLYTYNSNYSKHINSNYSDYSEYDKYSKYKQTLVSIVTMFMPRIITIVSK